MKQREWAAALGAALLLTLAACEGALSQKESLGPKYALPESTFTIADSVRDLNYWIEGDFMYVIGIADNHTGDWARIWVQLGFEDAEGNPVKYRGEETVVVRTMSDAMPPNGQSSFFAACELKRFNKKPAVCRVLGLRGVDVGSGPIIVTLDVDALRMLRTDSVGDTIEQTEFSRLVVGNIANPLAMMANEYCVELLLYGESDKKLWFVQTLCPGQDSVLWQERSGPLAAEEKRKLSCQVYFDNLPKGLQAARIGKLDMFPFEVREK